MKQQPTPKRKLTEAEKGMAKSLSMKDKPLTTAEKSQANKDFMKLRQENKRLNPVKISIVGKDMSKIPSVAKKLMELKAKSLSKKK